METTYSEPMEECRDDGWFWRGRRRVRKWFIAQRWATRVWEPHLDQTAHLEAVRWRLLSRYDAAWEKLQPLLPEVHAEGEVLSTTGCAYRSERIEHGPRSGDFSIIICTPRKTAGTEVTPLGARVSRAYRYYYDVGNRCGLFGSALETSFVRHIRRVHGQRSRRRGYSDQVRFVVNGRSYWMHARVDPSTGRLKVTRVSWPDADESVVDLDVEVSAS